jgi:flavin reductase (DIM6/NTAB) family NADH-FMN oxidoreductase RutF
MTIDPKAVGLIVQAFRSPVVAITVQADGRDNGMIALSGGPGSVIDDAMRLTVTVSKPNLTHDMMLSARAFALHLLPAEPAEALARSVQIAQDLGGHSGREGDKMAGLAIKRGVTGAPILLDALLYVECRLAKSFDCDEITLFLGDVVAAERLRKGPALDATRLWQALPEDWRQQYEQRHTDGLIAAARRARGLE